MRQGLGIGISYESRLPVSVPVVEGQFTLPTNAYTSAGVFKSDGETLVRTLWSWEYLDAGVHMAYWNGLDDNGNDIIGLDTYTIKVLYNNITRTWSKLGNTSALTHGDTIHRYLRAYQNMTIDTATGIAYANKGFCEGDVSTVKFDTADCQACEVLRFNNDRETGLAVMFSCIVNGMVVYAGYDPANAGTTFIYAMKISDDSEVQLTSGTPQSLLFGRTYNWAIAIVTGDATNQITGLAADETNDFIVVSRGSINQIKTYDFSGATPSGALLNTYTTIGTGINTVNLSNPRALYSRGTNVWCINSTGDVKLFAMAAGGVLTHLTSGSDKTGLTSPLRLAVNIGGTVLMVIHGGSLQVVRGYNASGSSTTPSWTLGSTGGYQTNATYSETKFYFSDSIVMTSVPFIEVAGDDSLWIGDPGWQRVSHFDSSRVFVEKIMAIPTSYSTGADRNSVGLIRVFSDDKEYSYNTSTGEWIPTFLYKAFIPTPYAIENPMNMLQNALTFQIGETYNGVAGNGLTYATIENRDDEGAKYPELVILESTGITFTGQNWGVNARILWRRDGTRVRYVSSGLNVGDPDPYVEFDMLSGFDGSDVPTFDSPVTVVTFPPISTITPTHKGFSLPIVTSEDRIVWDNPTILQTGIFAPHMGVMALGGTDYLSITCRSTFLDTEPDAPLNRSFKGWFPTDGTFDTGNNVINAGGIGGSAGRNIYRNYKGENWRNSQTNVWNHHYDNGLMLGQFGITAPDGQAIDREAWAMGAGNVGSWNVVNRDPMDIIFHNDESVGAAVHVWTIDDLDTINTISVPITPPTEEVLPGEDLMVNLPFQGTLATGDGWTRNQAESHVSNDNYYHIFTSICQYLQTLIDVHIAFHKQDVTYTVTRDLTPTVGLSTWSITGFLNYGGNDPIPDDDNAGAYLKILDDTGKVICQVIHEISYGTGLQRIKFNTATVVEDTGGKMAVITPKNQPITISGTASGVTMSYGIYGPTANQAVFEAGADPLTPTTILFEFIGDPAAGAHYTRVIDVSGLRYIDAL